MDEKVEMPVGEWFVRLLCKLIAFGAAIFGAGGFVIIGMQTILPMIDRGAYVGTACASIACIAVVYGLAPLAVEVDNTLLRLCGSMRLLPRSDKM